MDPALIKILTVAGVASAAALCASTITRFRNVPAASFASAGGVVPWLLFAMLFQWPGLVGVALVGLAATFSLFLLAAIFFSADAPGWRRDAAVSLAVIGLCAGIYLAFLLGFPLLITG